MGSAFARRSFDPLSVHSYINSLNGCMQVSQSSQPWVGLGIVNWTMEQNEIEITSREVGLQIFS